MEKVKKPSAEQVSFYQGKWEKDEHYVLQERSLKKLFTETYPENNEMDDVLIKVCSLNDFYSTNIYSPFKVANRILQLSIDSRLKQADLTLVMDIAQVKVAKGKKRNFYSFASKYCSHHAPDLFPIYDSYVDRMLRYFKKETRFSRFSNDELKDYPAFVRIIEDFRKHFDLGQFTLKQIDRYLWLLGKKHFPRKHQKRDLAK